MQDLTIKQKRFADEYLKSGNATQSYQLAGYKTKGVAGRVEASKLLTKHYIQDYIKTKQQVIEKKTILTVQQSQEILSQIILDCEMERTTDRLRAIELLTKMQGAYLMPTGGEATTQALEAIITAIKGGGRKDEQENKNED